MIERFDTGLINEGEGIVAGVSGGADSVCLLLNLCELKSRLNIDLVAVYIDHCIRGEESKNDGIFVKELCQKLQVEYVCETVDVPSMAKEMGRSIEEAARDLRYERLSQVAKNFGYKKLAIAHNADDNAETILFRLIRGTGIYGLCGMESTMERSGITVIRPLLFVTREEIEDYLDKQDQKYVTDATNLVDDYSRNRIRHRVMPELKAINSRAVEHINSLGQKLKEHEISEESTRRLYEEASGGRELDISVLKEHSPALRRNVIRLWIRDVGVARDVGSVHYEAIDSLIMSETGKSVDLPSGQCIQRIYDKLRFKDRDALVMEHRASDTPIPRLKPGEKLEFSMDGWYLRLTLHTGEDAGELQKVRSFQKNYAKYYDYGKIEKNMVLRHRMDGDFLVISPGGQKKPVARYFVDEKVPRDERDDAWLICTGSKVVLAVGYRGSEDMRVDDGTEEILEVEYWRT